jgi:hypothetical protein
VSRVLVPRLLATSSVVGTATAFRVGTGNASMIARRAPTLFRLAATASVGGDGAGRAQAIFRDELIGLYRDAAELSWRELRRAMDDLDRMTRPTERAATQLAARRYRVKA